MTDIPIACSLSRSALDERLALMHRIGADALLGVDRTAEGARLRFRSSPQTLADMITIRDAEAACCPFLELTLTVVGDRIELAVGATGPDGACVARTIAEVFTDHRSAVSEG